jgi:hypothetical protein
MPWLMLMSSILLLELMVMEKENSADTTSFGNSETPKNHGEIKESSGADGAVVESLGSGSFTTAFTLKANGLFKALRFEDRRINANSENGSLSGLT